MRGAKCLVCDGRAVHAHHVVTRSELKKWGGDLRDERNIVPLCLACHFSHHAAARKISLSKLPGDVWVFAEELMGEYGRDWLMRYYGA